MRHLAILAVPLIVTGCGIPPAVSIASYALDGVALVASGKTIKDHALSVAVGQDCSMFRVVSGEPVCIDYEPSRAAAAALEATPAEEMLVATADGRVIRVAAAPAAPGDDAVMTASAPPAQRPLTTTRDGRVILVATAPAAPGAVVSATPAPARVATEAAGQPAEDPLLTTRDGRVILVAAVPQEEATSEEPTQVHLSWVAPNLEDAATQ